MGQMNSHEKREVSARERLFQAKAQSLAGKSAVCKDIARSPGYLEG